jgi:hypothetical protein
VLEASQIFGTQPYMAEAAYRRDLTRGRIREEDIDAVLADEPDLEILPAGRLSRKSLRRAMLISGLGSHDPQNIAWHLQDGELRRAFRRDLSDPARRSLQGDRPQKLWAACESRLRPLLATQHGEGARAGHDFFDGLGASVNDIIHPVLIRLSGAYLDQGLAYWAMPQRETGFWNASLQILGQPLSILPGGLEDLSELAQDFAQRKLTGEEAVVAILNELGIREVDWAKFLEVQFLALPGWTGLFHQLETDPALAPHIHLPYSLTDILAIRLVLTLAAIRRLRQNPAAALPKESEPEDRNEAVQLCAIAEFFEVAQISGLTSSEIAEMPNDRLAALLGEIGAFPGLERRRLLHLAYERRHERQILIPLAKHRASPANTPVSSRLAAQVFFCIDEREESIRRHLEEIDPEIETFGAAGFFGVAVDYTGMDDAHGVALCPVVVKPKNEVIEQPVEGHHGRHRQRRMLRRLWAAMFRNTYISSRTLVRGWISTATLGFLSIFPLALRVLRPRTHGQVIAWLNSAFLPEPRTELTFERQDETGREATGGLLQGFSVDEKVGCVASVLGPAGLHKGMARIVVVLGHGSTSLNNPHESAHDCGACGGRRGGPNGRLFAAMANHPRVRQGLVARGIVIPEDTWFVGGYHDTCSDEIELFDLDRLPDDHRADLDRVRGSLDEARARSAHERARRFEAARPGLSFLGGLHHVQERAEHLGEPRPEYGHCTNAVCIVGRRETTRGLFFDRRAFLVSYDATRDPKDEGLARVLGAVIPVCGGINLEYYFSFVDNERYGCGTKLPHNITGLVGVMNGYQGDLRTGLPLQMVEIHEPVRILFVVETTPARVLATIRANAQLNEFLTNRWIRLATIDPDTSAIQVYRDGRFEAFSGDEEPLPVAPSSAAWYAGKIEHLPVARIEATRPSSAA